MRFRKLAGIGAGALVAGVLAVPALTAPAHAAPTSASTTLDAVCTYSSFDVPVEGTLTLTVDGADVEADWDATANLNASSLTTSELGSELTLDIDGEAVTVTGESSFDPPKGGSEEMDIPAMSGTRTATTAPSTFDVTAGKLIFTITFGTGEADCTFDEVTPGEFPAAPVMKDLSLTCAFGSNEFDYDTDVTLSAQATEAGIDLTADLEEMPNTAPEFVNLTDQEFVATLGTDLGDLTGTRTGDFEGGTPVAIPTMTGSVAGSGASLDIVIEEFHLAVGSSASIPCTLDTPVELAVPVEPLPMDLAMTCSFSGNDFAFNTDVAFSGQATNGGSVDLSAEFSDEMPNTAPEFVSLPNQEFVATLSTDLGDLTGTRTGDFQGGTPVEIPAMTGSVAGAAGSLPISVEGFHLAVGSSASIPCALDAPVQFAVDVEAAPVPPVTRPFATKAKMMKAAYAKKKQQAVIRFRVRNTQSAATPKGKVQVVVKFKGKKKVFVKKNAKLNKNGVLKLVVKNRNGKLNKNGKYTVRALFKGNQKFKKSADRGAFKVKKK